jgi:hypothetical protein
LIGATKAEPPFVAVMSNGTSGDITNVNFAAAGPGRREPYEQIKLVADSVARAAFAAYRKIKHRDGVTLDMAEKEIELGVRRPGKADLVRARAILAKANKPVLETLPEVYARETVLLAEYPPAVKVKLQAVRVGGLGIVAVPCEVFVEIGLAVKRRSALKPTFIIALANGYNGYLPTPEQHRLGGYETWRARSSYLEVDASTKITAVLLGLLGQVSQR